MGLVKANFLSTIGKAFSAYRREGYERAVSRILTAVDSGNLKGTDSAEMTIPVINAGQPGWLSPIDGIDWVELRLTAEELKLPLATVNDLLFILQLAIGNM
jgi:hypothetical protein